MEKDEVARDTIAAIATPVEFTRRAFLEGKLDLAQAEAVADLIDAASREAARSALRSLKGEFSAVIGALNAQLIELRAIVTPIPGTTRDALREPLDIDGVPVILVDTAGLRVSADEIERLGVERTRHELERADVVLAVFEAGQIAEPLAHLPAGAKRIDVFNKADLAPGFLPPATVHAAVVVSAKTGVGLDELRRAILHAAGWASTGESLFLARERHLRALESARSCLKAAAGELRRWEFFAEELRLAQNALGSITGELTTDDLLGEIFARFCIGK